MQINVAVNVKPFPVPTSVDTDNPGDTADRSIPLTQLDSFTLAQMCQAFTASVYKAAGKEPQPTKRTRSVVKREVAQQGCDGGAAKIAKVAK